MHKANDSNSFLEFNMAHDLSEKSSEISVIFCAILFKIIYRTDHDSIIRCNGLLPTEMACESTANIQTTSPIFSTLLNGIFSNVIENTEKCDSPQIEVQSLDLASNLWSFDYSSGLNLC